MIKADERSHASPLGHRFKAPGSCLECKHKARKSLPLDAYERGRLALLSRRVIDEESFEVSNQTRLGFRSAFDMQPLLSGHDLPLSLGTWLSRLGNCSVLSAVSCGPFFTERDFLKNFQP